VHPRYYQLLVVVMPLARGGAASASLSNSHKESFCLSFSAGRLSAERVARGWKNRKRHLYRFLDLLCGCLEDLVFGKFFTFNVDVFKSGCAKIFSRRYRGTARRYRGTARRYSGTARRYRGTARRYRGTARRYRAPARRYRGHGTSVQGHGTARDGEHSVLKEF